MSENPVAQGAPERSARKVREGLVVSDKLLDQVGPAANSARSLCLYGPPGNGKTTIAEGISRILRGYVLVPYAIEVDGQVIKVFDPLNHRVVPPEAEDDPNSMQGFSDETMHLLEDGEEF